MKKIVFATLILALLTACGEQHGFFPADDTYVSTSCIDIPVFGGANAQAQGVVVMDEYNATHHPFLLNLATNNRTPLTTSEFEINATDVVASPDRKTLAYSVAHPKTNVWNLVVSDAQGKTIKDIAWQKGFFRPSSWIDNEQLLIYSNPPFIIFNPYTNAEKDFNFSDLPGFYPDQIGNRYAVFDPAATKALYANSDGKISLLDINGQKILGEVSNRLAPYPTAAWAPDGSRIVVVGIVTLDAQKTIFGNDLFSITPDGKTTQLTHLTQHYGKELTIYSNGLSWSPDGRYIAFWLLYPNTYSQDWELAVFDTTTQKTTNYCIASNSTSTLKAMYPLATPIWSPDGKQIMVENRHGTSAQRVVILDIAQKTAFQVSENMYPAAWLAPSTP